MKLLIDNREKKVIPLIKALNNDLELNIDIEVSMLPLGDFIIQDNDCDIVIFERKSLSDLASSTKDGRYNEQSFRLSNQSLHNHNIVYVIEGDLNRYNPKFTRVPKTTLINAMISLQYYKGFSVVRTNSMLETSEFILRYISKITKSKKKPFYSENNKSLDNSNYCQVVSKVKKNNITPENIGEIILSQIPGVSAKVSMGIMKHFTSLHDLLTKLYDNHNCLKELTIDTNATKKVPKKAIDNIIQYLLYQKKTIISIET
uniref:ERCC4 domain-containing protein n=1 Tax=viral metagenome TaxID=1070528 RepID=A0A6C0CR71_9ZZZZ